MFPSIRSFNSATAGDCDDPPLPSSTRSLSMNNSTNNSTKNSTENTPVVRKRSLISRIASSLSISLNDNTTQGSTSVNNSGSSDDNSGGFNEEMLARQNLLHSLMSKKSAAQLPSQTHAGGSQHSASDNPYPPTRSPVGINFFSTPSPPSSGSPCNSSGRSSAFFRNFKTAASPGSSAAPSSPKSPYPSRPLNLPHRPLNDSDSSFDPTGSPAGYSAPTLSTDTARSTPLSPGTGEGSNSSGSEKVRQLYIEDFSFEIELRELKFARDRTGDKKSIGEGSFSRIFLAEWNGTPCAVKRMTKQQAGQMALERFQGEIAMMMSLRHPNIVQIFGGCWPMIEEGDDESKMNLFASCIVMEFCPMGSLFDVIRSPKTASIPWLPTQKRRDSSDLAAMLAAAGAGGVSDCLSTSQCRWDWIRQIARGMLYLHSKSNPVMHRDLKCSNVLAGSGYQMKITDFGESRRVQKNAELLEMSHAGTLLFMAPEMVTDRDYDLKIDVFSFGVMLIELFTEGDLLGFYKVAPALVMHKVVGGWRPSLEDIKKRQPNLATLVRKCWAQKPADRPSFDEILTYINGVMDDSGDIIDDEYYMSSSQLRHHAD